MFKHLVRLLLFIPASISFIFFFIYSSQKENTILIFERKYVNPPLLIGEYPIEVTRPNGISVFNSNVYIYDVDNRQIKKYSSDGKLIEVIQDSLNQKSSGMIKNFEIDSAGVTIADAANRGVFTYNQVSKKFQYDSIGIFDSGIKIAESRILFNFLDTVYSDLGFKIYNTATKKLEPINIPIKKYNDAGFANDGFFKKTDNQLLYVFYHLGKFMIFDSTLHSFKTIETIDKYQTPPKTVKSGHKTFLSRRSENINKDAAA